MAYKRKELIRQALEVIKQRNLVFIDDVVAYLPCSSKTFYNKELQKVQEIKDALHNSKVLLKTNMRKKWYESDNATLQIGLYKLIGSEEEAHRLNGSKIEVGADPAKPFQAIHVLPPPPPPKEEEDEKENE